MLASNPYVVIIALDFSKAFDTVRHAILLEKLSALDIPDNFYNWFVDYFHEHTHCTTYQNVLSDVQKITANIIQGSGIGPVSYVVCASDLKVVTTGNVMVKYADDTYLIIPACNIVTRETELDNVEKWALNNNLNLNRSKSSEILITDPRSKQSKVTQPPKLSQLERKSSIKILGSYNHRSSDYG
jgi:hypothetical protein